MLFLVLLMRVGCYQLKRGLIDSCRSGFIPRLPMYETLAPGNNRGVKPLLRLANRYVEGLYRLYFKQSGSDCLLKKARC